MPIANIYLSVIVSITKQAFDDFFFLMLFKLETLYSCTLKHPYEFNYKNYLEKYFIGIKHLEYANYQEESDNLKKFLWKSDDGMYCLDSFRI